MAAGYNSGLADAQEYNQNETYNQTGGTYTTNPQRLRERTINGQPYYGYESIEQLPAEVRGYATQVNGEWVIPASVQAAHAAQQGGGWSGFLGEWGPTIIGGIGGGLAGLAAGGAAGAGTGAVEAGATGAFDMGGVGALGSADAAAAGLGGVTAPAAGGAAGAGVHSLGTSAFSNAAAGAPSTAGFAPAGSALSRIIDGTATTADWTQVIGTGVATGGGMLASRQRANSLQGLSDRDFALRAPFYNKSIEYLNNPEAYGAGPGMAATKNTLAALGSRFGNPIGSGTALQLATDAGLRDWRDAVTGFGNMGLAGADTRASLGAQAANANADVWSNLGGGISDIINPKRSFKLSDLLA